MTKKNSTKTIARARQLAHGGHYQHHLRHVGGGRGGGRSGEGLVECPECGLWYCDDVAGDVRFHEARHRRLEEAAAAGIRVRIYRQREAAKSGAWGRLSDATTAEARLAAMTKICHCHWERSMEDAIHGGFWRRHPTFEEYACAYDCWHSPEHERLWRSRHPKHVLHGLAAGYSYWEPPGSARA